MIDKRAMCVANTQEKPCEKKSGLRVKYTCPEVESVFIQVENPVLDGGGSGNPWEVNPED